MAKATKERKQAHRLLEASGAFIARERKHRIWKLPSGRILVEAITPGDGRACKNFLATVRKAVQQLKEDRP